jgi:hypothetical protein
MAKSREWIKEALRNAILMDDKEEARELRRKLRDMSGDNRKPTHSYSDNSLEWEL